MSARQIAALLKSSRQDGWTNNNNNNNRMYAHQMHHNNNMINTTMYPELQLSASLVGQNVQPAQFTYNFNMNVNINMNATNNSTNNNPQQQIINSADINYSSSAIPLMVPSTAAVDSYPSGLIQHSSSGGDGYQTQQNNMIPTIPHNQINMQSYCKRNYDNAYEIAQRPQKQLKREQYSGVVSDDNNELYQHLSNKFGHTIMDKSTTTPEINNWLQSKDWRKMVSLHQVVSSESETIANSQQQYLLRSKTRNDKWRTYSFNIQEQYLTTTDRDRDIVKYKTIDLIHLLKWQELSLEETIDSITTITSPTTFKNKNTKSTNPRNLYKIVDPSTGMIVDDNTHISKIKGISTKYIKVPRNVRPGEEFQVLVDEQIVRVRCPLDPKQMIAQGEIYDGHRSIKITAPPVDTEKALEVVDEKREKIQWIIDSLSKTNKELSDKVATLEAVNKDKLRQLGKLDTDDQPILKQIKELEDICLRAHFICDQTSKMSIIKKIQELRYGYDNAYHSVNHSTDEDLILLTETYKKDQEIVNAKKWIDEYEVGAHTRRGRKVQVSAYTIKERASMRSKNAIINVYIDRLQYYRLLLVRHLRRCHKVLLDKKARGEKFLDSERYVQMHKLKQECITRGFVQYASPRDKVLVKLMDPLMNVPLNLYIGESECEWKAIMYRLQELLDNGDCYEKRVKQYIAKLRGLESERISKRNELVMLGVIIARGQDRDLYIPPPANRYFYMKSEAICIVTSQTVKSSVDRKLLIRGIVEAGYVSSESTFYDVLRRFEMGETILDDCWARGMKWRFKHNGPTPTFTNMCVKMPMCTASIMSATGNTFYNDCIDKSLPSSTSTRDTTEDTSTKDTSSKDTTEDTSSIDASNDQVYTGPIYSIPNQGERSGFLLLKATPLTFHHLRYLDEKRIGSGLPILHSDLAKPKKMNVVNYIGNDSQYEDMDGNHFYHYELTEEDYNNMLDSQFPNWKDWKEKDPIRVEERLMGNKICRLYLSTTEFPPLEPPKEIGDERNQYSQPIPCEPICEYRNRDLLAELGVSVKTKYSEDLIKAARDISRHEESTKEKEEKRRHERNMAMLSRVAAYIISKSKECGSPVVSHIYDKNKHIFQCQHCYKTDRECFTFKVAFDRHGFYIPLLNKPTDMTTFGHAWHNCECPISEDIRNRLVCSSNGIIERSSSESSSDSSSESSSDSDKACDMESDMESYDELCYAGF